MDPVLVVGHFQFIVEVLFKEIVLDGPLGRTEYYEIRVEFQIRGSPHIHLLLWIVDAPVLTEETIELCAQWVDGIISAKLPDYNQDPELYELVKTYQFQRHLKTCRIYKNVGSRFLFGRFFSEKTIVAKPTTTSLRREEKIHSMSHQNCLLSKVKKCINSSIIKYQKQNIKTCCLSQMAMISKSIFTSKLFCE